MSLTDAPVLRSFIQSAYPTIKRHNPDLPVLIREANGVPARIFARFGASLYIPPELARAHLPPWGHRERCRTTYSGGKPLSCRDHYQIFKVAQPVTSTPIIPTLWMDDRWPPVTKRQYYTKNDNTCSDLNDRVQGDEDSPCVFNPNQLVEYSYSAVPPPFRFLSLHCCLCGIHDG